ncbi:hypothetical protein [Streptomyces sp. NPDC021096]|uniref:hypothetical protein n=1 Tax=Streptomyces sp. NPDC021096 TaxID=3154792 RepID=UPI0033DB2617
MRRRFQRLLVAGAAIASVCGLAGAAPASAAPASQERTASAHAANPYIYGYYRLYSDCEVVGMYGVANRVWRGYVCDNRYLPGYIALVVIP